VNGDHRLAVAGDAVGKLDIADTNAAWWFSQKRPFQGSE
jgi:hypothetical protein